MLSFLAHGNPSGIPPTLNLDGISLVAVTVPEPSSWTILIIGFGLMAVITHRRRQMVVAA